MKTREFLFDSSWQLITWVCIGLSVAFFVGYFFKGSGRGMMWSGIVLIICILLMVGMVADRVYFPNSEKPKERPYVAQSQQEPDFPAFNVEASKYTFSLGGESVVSEYTPDQLKQPQRLDMSLWGAEFPISVYTDGKHLLADVVLREATNGQPEIALRRNTLSGKPSGWDTNTNKRAFEVVDETRGPVFQMIYKDKATIIINGIFCFNGQVWVAGAEGLRGPFAAWDDARGYARTQITRIFKYPSWEYEGILND